MIVYLITAGAVLTGIAVLLFICPSLRCRLGIHQWRYLGMTSILNPCPLKQCELCGAGEQANLAGFVMTYTPEQMEEILTPLSKDEEPSEIQILNSILEKQSAARGKTTDVLIYDEYGFIDKK